MDSDKPSELRNHFKDINSASSIINEPYSFLCYPQSQGQILEVLDFVEEIVRNEINAVTDNPLVFTKEDDPELPGDHAILSGGNFHGEYIAKAADYLALAIHDLAMMSEVLEIYTSLNFFLSFHHI